MIELLFNDGAAGTMQCVKSLGNGQMLNCFAEEITMDSEGNVHHEPFVPKPYDGPMIEGSPADIAAITAAFDIGDISNLSDWRERMELVQNLWAVYEDNEMDDDGWSTQEAIRAQELVMRLQTAATTGEPVRIWWSDAPNETCGFYWAMNILKNAKGSITSVKIPAQFHTENGYIHFSSTGDLSPEYFSQLLIFEYIIPAHVRRAYTAEWTALVAENAPLRAVINGKLCSVSVDFYDFVLRNSFPHAKCLVAEIIGRALGRGPGGISDWWYANRLRKMIDSGDVILMEHKAPFYGSIVMYRT